MCFTVVDNYYRQKHFDFFSSYGNPFYGVSFRVDASRTRAHAREHGYPIYLSLCYLATRAAQSIDDFLLRVREGRIVRYDRLDISATLPAPGGLFGFAFFDFQPELASFHRQAAEVARRARQEANLEEREHRNQLLFTALPKISFSHFSHPGRADMTDARPNLAFGKFTPDGDRLLVPVGLEVNHIFIDGNALGDFVEQLQHELDHPESPQ